MSPSFANVTRCVAATSRASKSDICLIGRKLLQNERARFLVGVESSIRLFANVCRLRVVTRKYIRIISSRYLSPRYLASIRLPFASYLFKHFFRSEVSVCCKLLKQESHFNLFSRSESNYGYNTAVY